MRRFPSGTVISGNITYQTGADNDPAVKKKSVSAALFIRDGIPYFDMTSLAGLCGYSVTGDIGELRFIDVHSGESARFAVGTTYAEVNDQPVRLEADTVYSGGTVYVPVSFLANYAVGVNAEWTEKNRVIKISRNITGYTEATVENDPEPVYAPLTFTLSLPVSSENVPESSLPESIAYATDPVRIANMAAGITDVNNPAAAQ